MTRVVRPLVPIVAGLLLTAQAQPAAPASADPISAQDRHDARCAAAFAIVAAAQDRGDGAARSLPPLGIRGKRYMGVVGARIAAQHGLSGAAVRDVMLDAAREVAHDGAIEVAGACLADLDSTVPARPAPDAAMCQTMLAIYAQDLRARDAGSVLATQLARESDSLAAAAHAAMAARGLDAAGEAAARAQTRTRMMQALHGGPAVPDADDFSHCRRLAAANSR